MPQLGETVTEGTITRWLKQVGDRVEADEPLFEVSTDKVDSEVPAPVAGVVTEILVPEGETVEVGTRLAVLGDAGCRLLLRALPAGRAGRVSHPRLGTEPDACARAPLLRVRRTPVVRARHRRPARSGTHRADLAPAAGSARYVASDPDRLDPPLTSPIVRRLVAERGLDARLDPGQRPRRSPHPQRRARRRRRWRRTDPIFGSARRCARGVATRPAR